MSNNERIQMNDKKSLVKLLFNAKSLEYSLFYSHKRNILSSLVLGSDRLGLDALADIKKRFQNIKFTSLSSLLDFCKSEKIVNLQIVFEWMNMFIYKDERKIFSNYLRDNEGITGIANLMEFLPLEKEDLLIINGFKCYQSELRTLLIKTLMHLASSLDHTHREKKFDFFINKLILNIFLLNFDEAVKSIKETTQSKELKVLYFKLDEK